MRHWSPGHWSLRVTVGVGPVLALALGAVARTGPAWWVLVVVAALSLAFAAKPESPYGLVAFLLVIGWWSLGERTSVPVVAIAAAAALLASHVAATLIGYGPPSLAVTRPLGLLWLRRSLLAFATAPAVWLVAAAVREAPRPEDVWAVALAAVLALSVAGALLFPTPMDRLSDH